MKAELFKLPLYSVTPVGGHTNQPAVSFMGLRAFLFAYEKNCSFD